VPSAVVATWPAEQLAALASRPIMAKPTRRAFVMRLMAAAGFVWPTSANAQTRPTRLAVRIVDSVDSNAAASGAGPSGPVRIDEFNMVGQYDIDWLTEPPLTRLLDTMAASPGAFGAVRFFHALDSGSRANTIDDDPLDGGAVWPDPAAPMDFSRTFRALAALTARGLTPFIGLNFFPKAVSSRAATPPASLERWQRLIRSFLDALAADPRFGPLMGRWMFEVWNEPNGRPFWRASYDPRYFDLYRATSEAVLASGHPIRLGGPAIIHRDGVASRRDMEAFLRFLSREPQVKCDFISLHAKGSWSSSGEPELRNVVAAAAETAELALAIDPVRFKGLPIINNEADMRVGFDIPYPARTDERFAAWLAALLIAYEDLSSRYSKAGFRFHAASDNANQQLVRESFDGRRSLCTRASTSARDLIKLPVFNFYEILRLLGDRHGAFVAGGETLFPQSELFHVITVADSHIASVFAVHPRGSTETPRTCVLDYTLTALPWSRVNIAGFRIDAAHSNAYSAAGGDRHARPFPGVAQVRDIRQAQELMVSAPIERGVELSEREFHDLATLAPYAVMAYWITPVIPDLPSDPVWIEAALEDGNVILRWRPNPEPFFYSYEVYVVRAGVPDERISPMPLRAAIWIDTAPPPGPRSYAVRAVSASGVESNLVRSAPVTIPDR
jgi:Glycosyl hydrolases family 39